MENTNKFYEVITQKYTRNSINYYEVVLKDGMDRLIQNDSTIEILWPNEQTSVHKVLCGISPTMESYLNTAYITINHNGCIVKLIDLTLLKGIKVRILP